MQINVKTLVLPMVCGIGWGGMAWFGLSLEMGEEAQNGGVLLSHVVSNIVYPLTALTASLVPSALLSQTKYAVAGNWWCVFFIVLLFFYLFLLMLSTGGFP